MKLLPRLVSFAVAFGGVALFVENDALGAITAVLFAIYLRLVEPK